MPGRSHMRTDALLPTNTGPIATACGDVAVCVGEGSGELQKSKGDFYQLAAMSEPDGSWFCLVGPPTAREPALDPTRPTSERRRRIARLASELSPQRGLSGLKLVDRVCVALRWDARRGELSVRRDHFGRVPLVHREEGRASTASTSVSTRPALITAWRASDTPPPLWQDFLQGRDSRARADFWPGVERVFPGEERRWRAGRWQSVFRPWDERAKASASLRHTRTEEPDQAEHLLQRLVGVLQRHLAEPDPVFAMSGGIDSTTLVALRSERERGVRTASMVSSRHPAFDERARIDALVAHFHTEHRFVDIGSPTLWTPEQADPGWPDLGPQLLWDAPYTRHFLSALRTDAHSAIFGIGADQLLLSLPVLHLEERARVANLSQLTTLMTQASSSRDRLRLLAAKARLSPAIRRWRGGLVDRRPLLFEGWKWDLSMRALERFRRHSGLRFSFPFLDDDLWELGLTLSHRQRRWQGQAKGPLRRALQERIPADLPQQGHHSIFNELTAEGLLRLFGPEGPWGDVLLSANLPGPLLHGEAQRQTLQWLRDGAPWRPTAPATTARYLTSIAMWLHWSRHDARV
ncbi:hypothetical protein FRC96_12050 [Lujinxingia vulgaris]|uniref:asparagine synthase (glutamine-hydrolyzing) n=1 Tax=Lujinxingia vulgaris TaxID=2600176 RepID=A0A5C6X8S7_9DELT|nr:asparagine synthetase B family protein [Lujinxingia vulgaris]TXD35110.1 hypothetical protein FRC96_12050 [Lujinxingia vulgaris]